MRHEPRTYAEIDIMSVTIEAGCNPELVIRFPMKSTADQ